MALIEELITEEGIRMLLWNPEESLEDLPQLHSPSAETMARVNGVTTEKRKREIWITDMLLSRILGSPFLLEYSLTGRPYLSGDTRQISISHTDGCIVVGVHSEKNIGIDAEHISPRAMRIRSKFMSEDELASEDKLHPEIYTLLHWSAKESMFKALNSVGVDFREHLHISPFLVNTHGAFYAQEFKTPSSNTLCIKYKQYPEFVLTYCVL